MSDRDHTLNEVPAAGPSRRIGRYRLIQCVGEGAFALVYFARDEETLAPVALKVLKDDIDPSIREQVRIRFFAEEKITRAIDHRYVVNIRETSPAEARPCFLAMDYVAGRPFSEHLERFRTGRLSAQKPSSGAYVAEVARLAHQVAAAMAAAHARGIVHRDLKPQNVLVTCDQAEGLAEIRIVDFGIAKAPVQLFSVANASSVTRYWTELGTVMGSPPCMAPEQCGAAQLATGKADVFALGVMLFGCLLGVDLKQLEQRSVQLNLPDDLETALALRGPLPEPWQELLRAMLQYHPGDRPDMSEVALRLQRLSRTEAAFAAAVEAWVRHRRVPRARQLLGLMQFADNARYLTEDERSFVKQAPLQKLKGLKRGLNLVLGTSTFLLLLAALGAYAHDAGWLLPRGPAPSADAGVEAAAQSSGLAAPSALRQASEQTRRELSQAQALLQANQARLTTDRTALENQRQLLDKLKGKLAQCQQQGDELRLGTGILSSKVEKLRASLERCDGESERLLACRQESASKSRDLLEATQRLQMCNKSLRTLPEPAADPLELGMSVP